MALKYLVNKAKAVINIGNHTVIAPTHGAMVDPELRGVQDLVKRGLLEEADAPADLDEAAKAKPAKARKAAEGDEKEPVTVDELKAWLDKNQVSYEPDAKKPELQGLYEAMKAQVGA